jgi:ATP-dependent protease HslVU (ClpYQ) peptidase subunit
MTTIAWDGKMLAADKLSCYGETRCTVTKIRRLNDGSLAGGAGDFSFILGMLAWLDEGSNPVTFPAHQRDKDDWQPVLHITTNGTILLYERTPHPIVREDPFTAIGSGKAYALAAMSMGASAEKAVAIAGRFDPATGDTIDVLTIR